MDFKIYCFFFSFKSMFVIESSLIGRCSLWPGVKKMLFYVVNMMTDEGL